MSEVIDQSQQQLDDRVLLRRFVQDADEAAFAEIVRRYQKLVMSVCGRILGYGQDAEDAFQATFICLARRPRSIRHSKALSSWLYTVAYRTSWRLIRHRKKVPTETLETDPMSQSTDPLDKISDAQDCVIVDEELNRLPVKFKDVLVMTYFADKTSQQIADTLNVSKGTVDGRLRDARNMLRVKLARRGVTIGAIALVASACTETTAAVSSTVLNSTLQLGSQTLANHAIAPPDLSRINHLIRPETTLMSTKMIAATMLGIAAAGALGFSGIVSAQQEGSTNAEAQALNASAESAGTGQAKNGPTTTFVSTAPIASKDPGAADTGQNSDPFATADPTSADPFGSDFGASSSTNVKSDSGPQKIYSPIPNDASPIEKRIYAALDGPTPRLDFAGESSLSEVLLEIMETVNQNSKSAGKITMVVDHRALEDEGLDSLDDILVREISLSGIELRKALKLILDQTDLDYLIRNDVLFLTSKSEASDNEDYFSTRIYPVKNLLALSVTSGEGDYGGGMMGGGYDGGGMGADMGMSGMGMGGMDVEEVEESDESANTSSKKNRRQRGGGGGLNSLPAQFGGGGGGLGGGMGGMGGMGVEPTPDHPLIQLVRDMTSPPCQWLDIDGQGGAISIAGTSLVVRQSRRGHEEIVKLLNLLANAKE